MLKRHQVLLNDWLAEYIKFHSEKFDLSFSEVLRMMLCIQVGTWLTEMEPKYKFKVSMKQTQDIIRKSVKTGKFEEEFHKLISQTYFEARKAAEHTLKTYKQKMVK